MSWQQCPTCHGTGDGPPQPDGRPLGILQRQDPCLECHGVGSVEVQDLPTGAQVRIIGGEWKGYRARVERFRGGGDYWVRFEDEPLPLLALALGARRESVAGLGATISEDDLELVEG